MNTRIKTGLIAALLAASIVMTAPQAFAYGLHGSGHSAFAHVQSHSGGYFSHGLMRSAAGGNFHAHSVRISSTGRYSHSYGYSGFRQPWREQRLSSRYWHGGYWHGAYWPGFRFGAALPLFLLSLPFDTVTYWYDGMPYYYANNAYYIWSADQDGYVATSPPPAVTGENSADSGSESTPAVTTAKLFIYPRNGQSSEQQVSDEQACRQWAGDQMQANSSPTDRTISNSSDYQRALTACLDGRGYTVK